MLPRIVAQATAPDASRVPAWVARGELERAAGYQACRYFGAARASDKVDECVQRFYERFFGDNDFGSRLSDLPEAERRQAVWNAMANIARSMIRHERRGGPADVGAEFLGAFIEARGNPTAAVDTADVVAWLASVLAPDEYEVLHLHLAQGIGFQELAALHGWSVGTAFNRFAAARQKARAALLSQVGDETGPPSRRPTGETTV